MTPFNFGVILGRRMKTAAWYDDAANVFGQGWNNAAKAFKGMTGAVGGTLGAVGAGGVAGGMQAANAVGGMFGRQPFSDEAINTAYGVADHYADVGSAYGKDFGSSMGMGPQGLAGTTNANSLGDRAWNNLANNPAVSNQARAVSNASHAAFNTAAKLAPAAAIAGGARLVGNYATGKPLLTNVSSFSPGGFFNRGAPLPAPTLPTTPVGHFARAAAQRLTPAANTAEKFTSGKTIQGALGKTVYDAATANTAKF